MVHILAHYILTRKGNQYEVGNAEFKMGDVVAVENSRGIMVLKWHDRRYVTFLSNSDETVLITRCSETVVRLQAVIDYSTGKSSVDLADWMSS
jgi:hypothetical protein